ncbi:MAG: hypothetical protein M0R03_03455 [Novosphingobium sp.]|nr:hypothetical protein [Novosphingobium sp.]
MSKVLVPFAAQKKFYHVSDDVVAAGWLAGQAFTLASDGQTAELATADEALFVAIDSPDELASPPTGSLCTFAFGSGTEIIIDHSEEVAAESNDRAYESEVESASAAADLYIGATGKWQTTPTGSVKGKMSEVPTADNNYRLGIFLRF